MCKALGKPLCIVCKQPGTLTAEGVLCDLHAYHNRLDACNCVSPNLFTCTLPPGHVRPHVAHGAGVCDVWTDEPLPYVEKHDSLIETLKGAIASCSMDSVTAEWEGVMYVVTAYTDPKILLQRIESDRASKEKVA